MSVRASCSNPPVNNKSVIRIQNLNHYQESGSLREQVFYDVSLGLYPGEIVILNGPSGSGKTISLTLCGALRLIKEGSVNVLGQISATHDSSDGVA